MYRPIDIKWMRRAIKLASLGEGLTSPNPLVGAVLLDKNGDLISEGFHHKAGMPHAEAMAFSNMRKDPKGGKLYVNLEPCCHHGRTPPCVNKIISSGVKSVYVSIKDPDERVAGRGINLLKNAGIKVYLGLCENEARFLNRAFIHKNLFGKSYGTLKWAMSMDGRISLKNGESKWITNHLSREKVHGLRASFDAIVIGGNTLRKDNPILTSRGNKEIEPLRVVFTRSLNLPEKCNLWDLNQAKTIVVFDGSSADESFLNKIPIAIDVEKLPSSSPNLLSELLAEKGFNNILWECGTNLATSALKEGCIQEIITFIAPKILGGENAMTPFSDLQFSNMNQVIKLSNTKLEKYSNDFCFRHTLN